MTRVASGGRGAVALAAFAAVACRAALAVELLTSCEKPGGWTLDVTRGEDAVGREVFTVSLKSPVPATPPVFDAYLTTSGADAHNCWVPISEESERSRLFASEWGTVRHVAALAQMPPISCVFNESDENRLLIAASECRRTVRFGITCHSTDARLEGRFRFFTQPEAPRSSYEVKILVDRRPVPFGEAVAEATRWIERTAGLTPCRVPEAAFEPLYSSWYAFWQDVHAADLEREARLAAELGMKSMILDDGWQKETSRDLYSATGDWLPARGRFPDFRAHVDAVHAAGIEKYLLWLSVPFVGMESAAYRRFEGKFLRCGKTVGVLDPRFPEVRRYLVDTYVRCVRDWDFDGLKLDFIDAFSVDANDPAFAEGWKGRDCRTVSEGVERLMADVRAALVAVKPDVLIEFRQKYIGPGIRPYGNILRATDCPSDLVGNRRRIADLRLTSGETAVHSDMLVWSPDDTPEDAGRVILNAIFGVVQYSMRLATLPESHRAVIRHWIGFANRHRSALLKGTFRAHHPELMYPLVEAADATERVVAVYAEGQVVPCAGDRATLVLNATRQAALTLDLAAAVEATAHDVFGRATGTVALACGLRRVDCPVSGYLSLAPVRAAAATRPSPEEVFANPPPQAHVGVWWHWMGRQVTEEGIVKDLDWMASRGVTSATIFGLADATVPWAKRIANVPTGIEQPYSDAWWKCVRRACDEGRRRGIGIGLHNCPGYTHSGGTWIPPRLAMRELVFGVRDVREIPLASNALFPVYNEDAGRYEKPDCAARRTDYVPLGTVRGVPVGHVPMGAFTQPCDWANRGLECDKMSREAVRFHLDAVFGELHRRLGPDLRAAGLTHILLDSYEAGTPTWTPEMPEEFRRRRGYDPMPYLPILGGYTNLYTAAEAAQFRRDFDRTVKDLYRDVLFAEMGRRVRAEGLELSCEPYGGPFETAEAAPHVDRLMTEFWFTPDRPAKVDCRAWARWRRPDGTRHNVIEAEAFTGAPETTAFTETPAQLKRCGDGAYLGGVNRLVLHSVVHQPWGDDVKPGVTMGRWGVHFGRNQVWGRAEKVWFDYCHRCQAVLQWGDPSEAMLDVPFGQIARTDGKTTVFFLVNASETARPLAADGKWLDPATGRVTRAPKRLAPTQSGFLIPGDGAGLPDPEPYDAARFEPEATWAELLKADAAGPDDLAYEAAPLGGAVLKAYPEWFDGGLSKRPTKRRWFSTWRHAK